MSGGTGHGEIETLLGAYALDAVEPDEALAVERHLTECPRCRAEVDAHREMAGALGTSVEAPPPELWDRIAGRLAANPAGPPDPRSPRLSEPPRGPWPPTVEDPATARGHRAAGGWRRLAAVSVVVAAAAVVVVAVLGVNLSRVDNQLNTERSSGPAVSQSVLDAALAGPHQVAHLRSPSGVRLAEVVLVPDGRGYLVSSALARLRTTQTYQLWGSIGGRAISLGLLGSHPGEAVFTVAGSLGPTELLVTVEPAGGVVSPDASPVAAGRVVPA